MRRIRPLRDERDGRSRLGTVLGALTPVELFSAAVVLLTFLLAIFGPMVAPYSPTVPNPDARLLGPSGSHWLGTDENGFDILSRIIAAPRTDVVVAVVATALSVAVGAPIGVLTGFFEGGRRRIASLFGETVLRLLDVIQAFPVFVLAMVLVAIRGASLTNIIAAIAFVNVPVFIRLVRSELLSIRERPYAEAARVVGNPDTRIAFRHLLPNALPPVIVQVSVTLGFAILLTAGLSFVGAGIAPPTPELGSMISTGSKYMVLGQWWPSLFPGIALGLIVFTFATLGEAVGRITTGSAAYGAPEGTSELGEVTTGSVANAGIEAPTLEADDFRGTTLEVAARPGRDALTVRNLSVEAVGGQGGARKLLDGVSLSLAPGEVVGVVGESGSGKSVLVRSLLRLLPEGIRVADGEVRLESINLLGMSASELRPLRGTAIAHILADPKSQLNPALRVGTMMVAVIRTHERLDRRAALKRAADALRKVEIPDPERRLRAYPHELSGGMAQRVCIALALLHKPSLIIADEPTFGLDVTVQRQVLDLMAALVRETGAAQLIVTRDLGIVAHYCRRVVVMHRGRIVETRMTDELFADPRNPYTRKLLDSVRPKLQEALA